MESFSVNKIGLWLGVSSDKGGGGMREVAPPGTSTLEGIITADFQQGGGGRCRFKYDKSSDNIFYSKKVQEIKKRICCCYKGSMFIFAYFTSIGGNCLLSRYIVFHIHFPTTSRIMLRF